MTVPPTTQSSQTSCLTGGACELQTISASQLGALLTLLASLGWLLVALLRRSANVHPFLLQYWIILAATAVYFLVTEWVIEEQWVQTLRTLKKPKYLPGILAPSRVEFGLRVLITIALAYATVPLLNNPDSHEDVFISLVVLSSVYGLFLIWDLCVAIGGAWQQVKRVAVIDAIAGALALSCIVAQGNQVVESSAVLLLGITALSPIILHFEALWSRIRAFSRATLR